MIVFAALASLSACHPKRQRTTSDGLPVSDKPGVTGDGVPVGNSVDRGR